MLLRRYGTTLQSVEANFDARALNEVGFRRDRQFSIEEEDFNSTYARVDEIQLTGEADGEVQDEVEQEVLATVAEQLGQRLAGLSEGEVLVVENEAAVDYPKTRNTRTNVIVDGENRFYFSSVIEPALRLGVFRRG